MLSTLFNNSICYTAAVFCVSVCVCVLERECVRLRERAEELKYP